MNNQTALPNLWIQSEHIEPKHQQKPILNLENKLYPELGKLHPSAARKIIRSSHTLTPNLDHLDFLVKLKEYLEGRLAGGASFETVRTYIGISGRFLKFAYERQALTTPGNLAKTFIDYSEFLIQVVSAGKRKNNPTYNELAILSTCLSDMLGLLPKERLIHSTRIEYKTSGKIANGKTAEKQNLENTFRLGRFLTSVTSGLTPDVILGQMPATIPIQPGLVDGDKITLPFGRKTNPRQDTKSFILLRAPTDSIIGTSRGRLFNLRIFSEALVFVAQTGMNIDLVMNLPNSKLKYRSDGDRWEVTAYKERRQGEVTFQIYKSYKPQLENLRKFTKHFFPKSPYLFPFATTGGKPISGIENLDNRYLNSKTFKNFLAEHNIPWIPPRILRNTRTNWLLRRSGDEDLTAELAQHSKQTLKEKYELPSQQRGMIEVTQFWNKNDPITKGELTESVIGSVCNGQPEAAHNKPPSTVDPNCINASGCLWCTHHRDVDTFDYVWSLASLKHLKIIEAALTITSDEIPADLVIERLTEKVNWYYDSSPKKKKWVTEAEERIKEGAYHPAWIGIIEFIES